MSLTSIVSTLAVVLFCSSALAQEAPSVPQELASAVAEAERLGALIYRHDQAAWHATDAAQRLKKFRGEKRLRGWLTQEREQDIEVLFVGARGDGPAEAMYGVLVATNGKPFAAAKELDPPQALTPAQAARFNARTLATRSDDFEPCSQAYNSVVLPGMRGDEQTWIVYLLQGTTDPNVIPAGGNFRFDVSYDGSTVLGSRAFTKSCLMLPIKDDGGERLAAVIATHLLDPTPTEVHVFLSLSSPIPLVVLTTQNGYVWNVERGSIHFVRKVELPPAP